MDEDGSSLKMGRQPVAFKPSALRNQRGAVTDSVKRRQERTAVGQTNRDQHAGPIVPVKQRATERAKSENKPLHEHPGYTTNLVFAAGHSESCNFVGSPMSKTAPIIFSSMAKKERSLPKAPISAESSVPKPRPKIVPPPQLTPLRPKVRYGCTVYPDTTHIMQPSVTEKCALYGAPELRFRSSVLDKFDLEDEKRLEKKRYDGKIARRIANEARVIQTYEKEEAEKARLMQNRALTFAYCRLKYYEKIQKLEGLRDKTVRFKPLLSASEAASVSSIGGGEDTVHNRQSSTLITPAQPFAQPAS
jgi:hypothetical protein